MPWWRGGDGKLGFGWRGEKVTSLKWKDGWNCYRGACGNRVLSIECLWQKQRCLQPSCHSGRDAPSDPLALVAFSVISTKRRVQKHNWLKTQGPSSILLDKPDQPQGTEFPQVIKFRCPASSAAWALGHIIKENVLLTASFWMFWTNLHQRKTD